jgi:hypothetical protein
MRGIHQKLSKGIYPPENSALMTMLVGDEITEFIHNMEADAIEDYEVERLLDIRI